MAKMMEDQPYDDRHDPRGIDTGLPKQIYLDPEVNTRTVTAPREDPLRTAVKNAVTKLTMFDAEDSEDVHNVRCEVIALLVAAL